MQTFLEVLKLGRDRLRGFILVAVLVSLGTGAALLEPWIYRAIIDDVAGVFVAEPAQVGELPTLSDLRASVYLTTWSVVSRSTRFEPRAVSSGEPFRIRYQTRS
jgi:hypothetical protein